MINDRFPAHQLAKSYGLCSPDAAPVEGSPLCGPNIVPRFSLLPIGDFVLYLRSQVKRLQITDTCQSRNSEKGDFYWLSKFLANFLHLVNVPVVFLCLHTKLLNTF